MKINQIIVNESMGGTCAGAVATVESPMGSVQTRSPVKGLQPAEKVIKGKAKKKGPYQNSIVEGKKDKVAEAELQEDDLIVIPGHGMKRKTGFVQHGQSRVDHEVDMARSDLIASYKNAKAIFDMLKDRSEEEGIEGWVQEKLIKAADYLNAVKEYLDGKMAQESIPHGGVIAGGGVGEGVAEAQVNEKFASQQQAKLMYAVAGDKDVAKKTGVSQKVAKEFIKKSHGQKVKSLPKKVKKKD